MNDAQIVRSIVGPCPIVNLMPTGPCYIEAVCCWPNQHAYILLDRATHCLLRRTDVEIAPLVSCDRSSKPQPARRLKPYSLATQPGKTNMPKG